MKIDQWKADVLTVVLVLGGAAAFAVVACGCAPQQVRVTIDAGQCGGVLLDQSTVLTAAHCATYPARAGCPYDSAPVMSWRVHPWWNGTADHDLAIGVLHRDVACQVTEVGKASGPLWWRSHPVRIEESGPVLTLDASPERFCVGNSGEPILNEDGRVVALVSRWWSSKSACSTHVHASAVDLALLR